MSSSTIPVIFAIYRITLACNLSFHLAHIMKSAPPIVDVYYLTCLQTIADNNCCIHLLSTIFISSKFLSLSATQYWFHLLSKNTSSRPSGMVWALRFFPCFSFFRVKPPLCSNHSSCSYLNRFIFHYGELSFLIPATSTRPTMVAIGVYRPDNTCSSVYNLLSAFPVYLHFSRTASRLHPGSYYVDHPLFYGALTSIFCLVLIYITFPGCASIFLPK